MKQFTDSPLAPLPAKLWTVALNIGAVKRVKSLLTIDGKPLDLLQPHEGTPPLIERLTDDPILVVDVLWVLVMDEAKTADISDEQFAARLGGDGFCRAWEALQDELIDFFQKLGRPEAARVIEAQKKVVAKTSAAMNRKVGDLEAAALRMIEQKEGELDVNQLILDATRGKSSTSSPASSA